MTLTSRILLAMVAGLTVGIGLNLLESNNLMGAPIGQGINDYLILGLFDTVGRIFVASLKLLVVPLVFVSLVCGSSGLGDNSRMGAMAGKTLLIYLFTTAIAISIALLLGEVLQPGASINLGTIDQVNIAEPPSLADVIVGIVPSNPIEAMANGNMLQVIVFSILMGIALSKSGDAGIRARAWFEDFNVIILRMVAMLMELAPYGVFCLLAKLFAGLGAQAILDLGLYFFAVAAALLLHSIGVYGGMVKLLVQVSPLLFFKHLRPVLAFAFSTASSSATLPVTLRTAEERLGVDNKVASFTVPLGSTINMDGTAIMQGVATAFIAQAYGVDLSLGDYLTVILTATLASIGTAGVPGVGLIMLAMVLQQVGLPVEGIAVIIGVDRLLDMMRTAVNVTGDSMVSMVVAKSEGSWDKNVFDAAEHTPESSTEVSK